MSNDRPRAKVSFTQRVQDNPATAVTSGVVALALILSGFNSYKIIDAGHFGVNVRMGQIVDDRMEPGFEWKIPWFEQIHELQNNTIILEDSSVGTGDNTYEQNALRAEMRLHYQIDTTQGVLALHINTMKNNNGARLLRELMDQSMNAVVGERHSSQVIADKESMLRAFADNLEWRLNQNNVPIRIDSVELLVLRIGTGEQPYRTPVQLKLRRVDEDGQRSWAVESMAGPSVLPVPNADERIQPQPRDPLSGPQG